MKCKKTKRQVSLLPRNLQITLAKENDMKNGKSKEKKRRMSKNTGVAIWDFLEIVFAPKNCLTEDVYLKNPARCDLYCLYRDIEYDLLLSETVFDLRFHTGELSVSTGYP